MTTASATEPKLVTAEEYLLLPDDGRPTELRRGVVIYMNPPGFRHGEVCSNINYYVANHARNFNLGRTLTNDSGIITKRNPDTVRGADVAFYSYQRVAKGQSPVGYAGASPEIVFEVLSPTNTRHEVAEKTAEYLKVGVNVVCVVDPQQKSATLNIAGRPAEKLEGEVELRFADLPGLSLPVARLFE